jgi:hypothetical protein
LTISSLQKLVGVDQGEATFAKLLDPHVRLDRVAAPRRFGERARIALGEARSLSDRLEHAIAQDRIDVRQVSVLH